jgi:tripartite-type tricarboxylate transporter receptor subunit TctC
MRAFHHGTALPRALAATVAVVALLSGCSIKHRGSGADASGPADFKGKTITIVTNATAGGSSDVLARLIAAKLGTYLPGNPTVIVKNITGGAGSVEISQVASVQPANGLTIGEMNSGIAVRYLTKQPGFDPLPKMPVIGGFPQGSVQIVNKGVTSDLSTLAHRATPLRIGQTSAGGTGAVLSIVAQNLLNIPSKQVYGFSGGSAESTSMQRGELDSTVTADLSYDATFAPDVKSGRYLALYQCGIMGKDGTIQKSPLVSSDIPTVLDLYKQQHDGAEPTGEAWDAYKLLASTASAYTTLVVRDGTPANLTRALEDGFRTMVASSDWKTLTQQKLTAPAIAGELTDIQKAWVGVLNSTPDQIALFEKYSGLQS